MNIPSPQLVSEVEHGIWLLVHGLRVITPDDPLRSTELRIGQFAGLYCLTENGWSKDISKAVTFNERDEAEEYRDRRSNAYFRQLSGQKPGDGVPWDPLPE